MQSLDQQDKFEILLRSPYTTIIQLCQSDKDYNAVCLNNLLWKN